MFRRTMIVPYQLLKRLGSLPGNQSGVALLETLVALALLGAIAVAFLSGLSTSAKATVVANEQNTAESLALAQMEWAKQLAYSENATGYAPAPVPDDVDYTGYSASITAEPVHATDDGIQKITVTVTRNSKEVLELESYKVDR